MLELMTLVVIIAIVEIVNIIKIGRPVFTVDFDITEFELYNPVNRDIPKVLTAAFIDGDIPEDKQEPIIVYVFKLPMGILHKYGVKVVDGDGRIIPRYTKFCKEVDNHFKTIEKL